MRRLIGESTKLESTKLIEAAKKERELLREQIEESRRTILRSRQIMARIDKALAYAPGKKASK
jgi:hypothetical protein